MCEILPVLRAKYGLSRSDALALPHWEFHSLYDSAQAQDAQEILGTMQSIGLAMGGTKGESGKLYESLMQRAGYLKSPEVQPEPDKPWSDALVKFLG